MHIIDLILNDSSVRVYLSDLKIKMKTQSS